MRRAENIVILLCGLFACASIGIGEEPKSSASDLRALQGEWRFTAFIEDSERKTVPGAVTDDMGMLVISANSIKLREIGLMTCPPPGYGTQITFQIDSGKKPKHIDLMSIHRCPLSDRVFTKRIEAIYRIDEDVLMIAYPRSEEDEVEETSLGVRTQVSNEPNRPQSFAYAYEFRRVISRK
jgi:uncharacterized protein (TIGR03067 family)